MHDALRYHGNSLFVDLFCHHGGRAPHLLSDSSHSSTFVATPTLTIPTSSLASNYHTTEIPNICLEYQEEGTEKYCLSEDSKPEESYVSVSLANAAGSQNYSLVEEQMKAPKTKATIGILSTLIAYVSINSWLKATHPDVFVWQEEDLEDASWVATSKSWVDRKTCRWLGVCGGTHLHFIGKHFGHHVATKQNGDNHSSGDWENAWSEGNDRPEDWTNDERVLREIPDYVLEYAPLVHLFSEEQFWPGDIAEHLDHITPNLNYTPLQSQSEHPTLTNLDDLNQWQRGRWVFLKSNDNVEERPVWLEGEKNIPKEPDSSNDKFQDNDGWVHYPGRTYLQGLKDAAGDLKEWFGAGHKFPNEDDLHESETAEQAHARILEEQNRILHYELKRNEDDQQPQARRRGGRSDAPAVLITINKGQGVVDAFWFFFYSFNLGNVVFNVRFGNHVGDWEHTCIRFHHGKPKAVFFSEHSFGKAYSYEAVEKYGKRPVIYSATGTHAMYATPGDHAYILPWGLLKDRTDRGPLWDPALNSHAFTYDYKNNTLRSSNLTPNAPIEWFQFAGHWGDKFYPLNDRRQYRLAGQYHYVNGPLGPKFKNLGRKKICGGSDSETCIIKHWLGGEDRAERLQGTGEHADMFDAETERLVLQG